MHPAVRIGLYLALMMSAGFFTQRFLGAFSQRMNAAATSPPIESGATNAPAETAEAPAGEATLTAPSADPSSATNLPAADTNLPAATNPPASTTTTVPAVAHPGTSPLGVYAALGFGSILVLGLLLAHDLAHFLANRAHAALYNEDGEGFEDPEYDQAEQLWADGEHLEAIRIMREYFARKPREIHVKFRIAEIYEKDLNNPVAAALEYEEILNYGLSRERWGWGAIHLCNLYNRLNQPDKADALLRRIVNDYGETAAARKAREHLDLPEFDTEAVAGESESPAASGPKLPPGFRPKKR